MSNQRTQQAIPVEALSADPESPRVGSWTIITMTVQEIKELHFSEEASVERIDGVDWDCLVDAFDNDPDQYQEARLFEDLYGWNQVGIGGRSRGIIWYDLGRGGILALTSSEIYLFEVQDPAAFSTCLAQIRTAFRKQ